MTQDMKKEPILQMGTDKMIPGHVMAKLSRSDFLTEVNGKTGFTPIGKRD
jgi:hypothetical protein